MCAEIWKLITFSLSGVPLSNPYRVSSIMYLITQNFKEGAPKGNRDEAKMQTDHTDLYQFSSAGG